MPAAEARPPPPVGNCEHNSSAPIRFGDGVRTHIGREHGVCLAGSRARKVICKFIVDAETPPLFRKDVYIRIFSRDRGRYRQCKLDIFLPSSAQRFNHADFSDEKDRNSL